MNVNPLGDSAVLVEFGAAEAARARDFGAALAASLTPGILEVVPAFATVAVHYDPARVGFSEVENAVRGIALPTGVRPAFAELRRGGQADALRGICSEVEIPVCYGGEHGPDLEALAVAARITTAEAIALHASAVYDVEAVGFIPGFPYLGGLPDALRCPRRSTPRTRVPAGSVGIGDRFTGVYPFAVPGGWNLIGRTPLTLFDAGSDTPARLRTGDRVRFRPISAEEFAAWK